MIILLLISLLNSTVIREHAYMISIISFFWLCGPIYDELWPWFHVHLKKLIIFLILSDILAAISPYKLYYNIIALLLKSTQ